MKKGGDNGKKIREKKDIEGKRLQKRYRRIERQRDIVNLREASPLNKWSTSLHVKFFITRMTTSIKAKR